MKRLRLLILFNGVLFMMIIAFSGTFQSCTKEGPMGPQGPSGEDGMDANAVCITCHNLATRDTVEVRYMASRHGQGGIERYAGSRNDCAKCHSHQGFEETTLTGRDTTAENFHNPGKITCETCHDEHKTLDFEEDGQDYALAHNEAVSLMITGHETKVDLKGSSNMCAYCHQPRKPSGNVAIGGNNVTTEKRWGPHYGGQAVVLGGKGAYEFDGSASYENSAHTNIASCADCHMAETGNMVTGGHTMKMHNEDGSDNMAGCTQCHSEATDFDINGVQTDFDNLMATLEDELVSRELINVYEEGVLVVPNIEVSATEAASISNFLILYYDGSHGVHNTAYAKALLTNTIEKLQSNS